MAMQYKVVEPDCGIKVTKVTLSPVCNTLYTKAMVTVELNHCLTIRDLRVMDGQYGLFVAYPLDKNNKCEEPRSLIVLTDELRAYIEAVVVNQYAEMSEAIEDANTPVWVKELRA